MVDEKVIDKEPETQPDVNNEVEVKHLQADINPRVDRTQSENVVYTKPVDDDEIKVEKIVDVDMLLQQRANLDESREDNESHLYSTFNSGDGTLDNNPLMSMPSLKEEENDKVSFKDPPKQSDIMNDIQELDEEDDDEEIIRAQSLASPSPIKGLRESHLTDMVR